MSRLTKAESIKQATNPTCRHCGKDLVTYKKRASFKSNWLPSDAKAHKYECIRCQNRDKSERGRIRKDRAIRYLGGKCDDCDGEFIRNVYDFHHRVAKDKVAELSSLWCKKWETIQEELDKCDLLCSNCHRIRHYEERIAA